MQKEIFQEQLAEYVELITKIRILSVVFVNEPSGAESYSKHLRDDYKEIGNLSARCREILDNTIYPLLQLADHIEPQILEVLQDFCYMLFEPASGEELDFFLLYEISERLLREFEYYKDENHYVLQLNIHIRICIENVVKTTRITVSKELATSYRDSGLKAAETIGVFLKNKEKYSSISNEAKLSILSITPYYSALYNIIEADEEVNQRRIQALYDAAELYDDSFYWINTNNYNWENHRIQCLYYLGQLTEYGNRLGYSREHCEEIYERLEELKSIWDENPAQISKILPESLFRLVLIRNAYYAEKITKKEYQNELLSLYNRYRNNEYDKFSVQSNLLISAEYLYAIKGDHISVRAEEQLKELYRQVIDYILHSVNMDAFYYIQKYMLGFLEAFIEIPGVFSFEEMALHCVLAIHPPTFVHSVQVAQISKCLASYLLEKQPEIFIGEYAYADEKQVLANKSNIIQMIYHCGLCHDIGKMAMIDSLFIYGRNLLDREFELIKKHAGMGAELLMRYSTTKAYASVARQHHLWFNQKGGYPTVLEEVEQLIASNIVEVADSIDAATDTIGRSYNKGKRFDEICNELFEESGTRYAPYVVELLQHEDVLEDISYLLVEGRQRNYKNAYLILTGQKEEIFR